MTRDHLDRYYTPDVVAAKCVSAILPRLFVWHGGERRPVEVLT